MAGAMRAPEAAQAARRGTGVVERARSVIQVTGPERLAFLDGLLTADVKRLAPGAVAYAAMLNVKARVLGDLFAYDVGEGYLLDTDRSLGPKVLSHLQTTRVSEVVDVLDRTADFGRLTVLGAGAEFLLQVVLGIPPPEPGRWVESGGALVARTDELGLPGFEFLTAPDDLALRDRLLGAGALRLAEEAWEVLRIEAGVPRYGRDVDEGTIALEAPLHRAIAFDKGCYVGQEVVARVANRGHLKRYLVGLTLESDLPPPRGSKLWASTTEVGEVTSSAYSATLGSVVALAYVKAELDVPGTVMELREPRGAVQARVSALPFVPVA